MVTTKILLSILNILRYMLITRRNCLLHNKGFLYFFITYYTLIIWNYMYIMSIQIAITHLRDG